MSLSILSSKSNLFNKSIFLESLFLNAENNPSKVAIKYNGEEITYSELLLKSRKWSLKISQYKIDVEEPIAILLEPSIDAIIAQLAVLLRGGTCVPLDISQPKLRLESMISNLNIRLCISNNRNKTIFDNCKLIDVIGLNNFESANYEYNYLKVGENHRTHILHTSGTTGKPKAVEIMAKGIMRLVYNKEFSGFNFDDNVAHISNVTFDASLFEIYGALLNGATLIIISKEVILNVYSFKKEISDNKINVLAITTALFNLIALTDPTVFKGIHTVIVGGEPANRMALKNVLEHSKVANLRNGYGPTECTTYVSTRHITLEYLNSHESIDVGYPIDDTEIIILDQALNIVETGEIGEIAVSGTGVARGYANNDIENNEKFKTILINGHQKHIYRTGDLGRITRDGFIECLGRKDNQLKIRGHRINLEELEYEILKNEKVHTAVVDGIRPIDAKHEAYINAYIVFKTGGDVTKLKADLIQKLPQYMVPRLYEVKNIPLNQNGKADKKKLYAMIQMKDENEAVTNVHSTLNKLKKLWETLLDLSGIQSKDTFFGLGGSSLQVATLVIDIEKTFGINLQVIELYDYPSLRDMANLIDSKLSNSESLTIDNTLDILKADGNLELPKIQNNRLVKNWLSDDEGNIFLTGCTGFLGAFFLADLCKEANIKNVYCLVRAHDADNGLEKIVSNLEKYGVWNFEYLNKIVPICGSLEKTKLGLTDSLYQNLAESISCIFHLAAHVNYIQPYSVHRPANVVGTMNVLEFSLSERVKPLHYTSSIAAYGPTGLFNGTQILGEDEPLDHHLNCLKYDSGYSQSQWVAEKIMTRAQQEGLPVNIYRPGFIMGDSLKGIGNEKDFVARFLKGCLQIKAFPCLEKQKKEFIAVDYVSSSLLKIAKLMIYGGKYNFVPVDPKESINLIELYTYLLEYGYKLELVDYQKWVEILENSKELDNNPLLPLLPMLKEPVYGNLTRWEVYENMPIYSTDNVKAILGHDIKSPTLNKEILHKYLGYWIKSKFIFDI